MGLCRAPWGLQLRPRDGRINLEPEEGVPRQVDCAHALEGARATAAHSSGALCSLQHDKCLVVRGIPGFYSVRKRQDLEQDTPCVLRKLVKPQLRREEEREPAEGDEEDCIKRLKMISDGRITMKNDLTPQTDHEVHCKLMTKACK